ncbi:MAG: vWA domain-containing protein [Candidatus Paceibacterota bacterium]
MISLSSDKPFAFLFLFFIPLYFYIRKRLNKETKAEYILFTGAPLLRSLIKSNGTDKVRYIFSVLSSLLLVTSLSNPVITRVSSEESVSVVFVIDISASMRAVDVQPSRLAVAKRSAIDFVNDLPRGYFASLIAYDSVPRLLVPPTTDKEVLVKGINGLTTGAGTATGDALDLAIDVGRAGSGDRVSESINTKDLFTNPVQSVILLLSDGAQNGGVLDWESSAQRASRLGIPVHAVAFGTSSGVIDISTDNGLEKVSVPPDELAMREISAITNGKLYGAKDKIELERALKDVGRTLTPVEKSYSLSLHFAFSALFFGFVAWRRGYFG